MTTIIDITDILVDKRFIDGLTRNHTEALKHVGIAHSCVKSSANWEQGKENYLRHCRRHLEQALVYINEELEGEQEES